MKNIYALHDKLDDSISMHFIGGEGASDVATLRAVRAQFKEHYAVKDLSLFCMGAIGDDGVLVSYGSDYVFIGELYPNSDTIENA